MILILIKMMKVRKQNLEQQQLIRVRVNIAIIKVESKIAATLVLKCKIVKEKAKSMTSIRSKGA